MTRANTLVLAALVAVFAVACGDDDSSKHRPVPTVEPVPIGPLPALDAPDPKVVELGKILFFDYRLSGDSTLSCADCHNPKKGWGDGRSLSKAYPGSEYFRNAKTLLNMGHADTFYWDGRLDGSDPATQVRDSIAESHFMNMDGRLMLERLKQIPVYVRLFEDAMGGEPSYGRTLKAIAAFEKTLVSNNVPFDSGKLSPQQALGRKLFEGKAGCINCHHGPYFSDGLPHKLGLTPHPEIRTDATRQFTLRAWAKFLGVPDFEHLKADPGHFVVTKQEQHRATFITPTLRELVHTGPYMHDGSLATLEDVVDFYNAGAGDVSDRDPLLRSLGLSADDKADLIAFLKALSGDALLIEAPKLPPYQVSANWHTTPN